MMSALYGYVTYRSFHPTETYCVWHTGVYVQALMLLSSQSIQSIFDLCIKNLFKYAIIFVVRYATQFALDPISVKRKTSILLSLSFTVSSGLTLISYVHLSFFNRSP